MADQTPLDRFKRALTGTARALARESEVEVAWSADAPSASGRNFRVPLPGRDLPPAARYRNQYGKRRAKPFPFPLPPDARYRLQYSMLRVTASYARRSTGPPAYGTLGTAAARGTDAGGDSTHIA